MTQLLDYNGVTGPVAFLHDGCAVADVGVVAKQQVRAVTRGLVPGTIDGTGARGKSLVGQRSCTVFTLYSGIGSADDFCGPASI